MNTISTNAASVPVPLVEDTSKNASNTVIATLTRLAPKPNERIEPVSSMKIPQILVVTKANRALCMRIGVKINGVDQGTNIAAYSVPGGIATLMDGTKVKGVIEPYWRTPINSSNRRS